MNDTGNIALYALSMIRESIAAHGEFKDISDATDLINYIAGVTDFATEIMYQFNKRVEGENGEN